MKVSKHYKDTLPKIQNLTKKQLDEMHELEKDAIARFTGQMHELESAIGMLRIGHYFGWKVLYIIHNKRTIKKYEEMLKINVKEYFPESGPISELNYGYKTHLKIGQFWKIVSGDVKVDDKKEKT